jgi:riboflavin synthase
MFTGIVDHCGQITSLEKSSGAIHFFVQSKFEDVVEGESIAIDGVCLTAISPESRGFWCDVSPETIKTTLVDTYAVGTSVNLERALTLSDRLGGYLLAGHVEQRAVVGEINQSGEFFEMLFTQIQSAAMGYLLKKGNVAVNGVSLTINEVTPKEGHFKVMIIPHTLERTNLGKVSVGSLVNIEFDYVTKVIVAEVNRRADLGRE